MAKKNIFGLILEIRNTLVNSLSGQSNVAESCHVNVFEINKSTPLKKEVLDHDSQNNQHNAVRDFYGNLHTLHPF